MKAKILILMFYLSLITLPCRIFGQVCGPPNGGNPPDHDSPDDNFSFGVPIIEEIVYYSSNPDVLIFKSGYFKEATILIAKIKKRFNQFKGEEPLVDLLESIPILVIPSGGLFGMEKSEQFKAVLRNYVENGGFLIVFAQQHGYEFSCLPTPDGKPITGYGWREDLSCQANSVYLSAEHPALSGLIRTTPSIVVDGYFEQIPNNSVVLLRRTKNGMPCAFFYQLGAGYVFVTSMYEDWASTNWQSTAEGRVFIRDLITWAKKPSPLPTYNISENPHPIVSLNIEIKNSTEKPAGKVKILWLNLDKILNRLDTKFLA